MDAATFDAFAALDGNKAATYPADNALFTGTTTAGRTGVSATVKDGAFANNETVSSYMVLFNNASAADATYYAYTATGSTTISSGGADDSINFGTFANATSTTGGWQSTAVVPEPTSGLLMLGGLAGLALRRRRA